MIPGHPIVETATILAASATLAAFPVAWFAYRGDERRSRERLFLGVQNVIDGLRPEMEIVGTWTAGVDGRGYPSTGDEIKDYHLYKISPNFTDWKNPIRGLRPLVCPAIERFSSSEFIAYLGPLLRPFALLNLAIAALAKAEAERSNFATGDPAFLAKMFPVYVEKGRKPTPEQEEFMEVLFFFNFAMHVSLIGSAKSPEENALFRAHHTALKALDDFEADWKGKTPRPRWWENVVTFFACLMVAGAAALCLRLMIWAIEPSIGRVF